MLPTVAMCHFVECAVSQNVGASRISRGCTLERSDHIARSASHCEHSEHHIKFFFVILQKNLRNGNFI